MEIIIPEKIESSETKEFRNQFDYSLKMLQEIKSYNYYIESFYLSLPMSRTIFITSLENIINEDFIDLFYNIAFRYESLFKNKYNFRIYFSFIGNKNINENELEFDSFKKYII